MKILRCYAVTYLDLWTESSVNKGNTTAQLFNLKILFKVFVLCNSNYNKFPDANTAAHYSTFYCCVSICPPCLATATIKNSLMLIQLHITAHFIVVLLYVPMPCNSNCNSLMLIQLHITAHFIFVLLYVPHALQQQL